MCKNYNLRLLQKILLCIFAFSVSDFLFLSFFSKLELRNWYSLYYTMVVWLFLCVFVLILFWFWFPGLDNWITENIFRSELFGFGPFPKGGNSLPVWVWREKALQTTEGSTEIDPNNDYLLGLVVCIYYLL